MVDESKLLLTGGTGRLGKACRAFFPQAQFTGSSQLDVTSPDSVRAYFDRSDVTTIIHMASFASVAGCEKDPVRAYEINVLGAKRVLEAARDKGVARFFYLSTACVFQGDDPSACPDEDDIPYPKNYYGLTKYTAEEICRTFHSPQMAVTVLRTNFTSMPWAFPKAFTDRFGTYLFDRGVAQGLKDVLLDPAWRPTIHICGDRKMSMYDYARSGGSSVEPITMAEYRGAPLTINMAITSKYWRLYRLEDAEPL